MIDIEEFAKHMNPPETKDNSLDEVNKKLDRIIFLLEQILAGDDLK